MNSFIVLDTSKPIRSDYVRIIWNCLEVVQKRFGSLWLFDSTSKMSKQNSTGDNMTTLSTDSCTMYTCSVLYTITSLVNWLRLNSNQAGKNQGHFDLLWSSQTTMVAKATQFVTDLPKTFQSVILALYGTWSLNRVLFYYTQIIVKRRSTDNIIINGGFRQALTLI